MAVSVCSLGVEQQDHADRITQARVGNIPSTLHWFCTDLGVGLVAETRQQSTGPETGHDGGHHTHDLF